MRLSSATIKMLALSISLLATSVANAEDRLVTIKQIGPSAVVLADLAVSQTAQESLIEYRRSGKDHQAAIQQGSEDSLLFVSQSGEANIATINQDSPGSTIRLEQSGFGNQAVISQY